MTVLAAALSLQPIAPCGSTMARHVAQASLSAEYHTGVSALLLASIAAVESSCWPAVGSRRGSGGIGCVCGPWQIMVYPCEPAECGNLLRYSYAARRAGRLLSTWSSIYCPGGGVCGRALLRYNNSEIWLVKVRNVYSALVAFVKLTMEKPPKQIPVAFDAKPR